MPWPFSALRCHSLSNMCLRVELNWVELSMGCIVKELLQIVPHLKPMQPFLHPHISGLEYSQGLRKLVCCGIVLGHW